MIYFLKKNRLFLLLFLMASLIYSNFSIFGTAISENQWEVPIGSEIKYHCYIDCTSPEFTLIDQILSEYHIDNCSKTTKTIQEITVKISSIKQITNLSMVASDLLDFSGPVLLEQKISATWEKKTNISLPVVIPTNNWDQIQEEFEKRPKYTSKHTFKHNNHHYRLSWEEDLQFITVEYIYSMGGGLLHTIDIIIIKNGFTENLQLVFSGGYHHLPSYSLSLPVILALFIPVQIVKFIIGKRRKLHYQFLGLIGQNSKLPIIMNEELDQKEQFTSNTNILDENEIIMENPCPYLLKYPRKDMKIVVDCLFWFMMLIMMQTLLDPDAFYGYTLLHVCLFSIAMLGLGLGPWFFGHCRFEKQIIFSSKGVYIKRFMHREFFIDWNDIYGLDIKIQGFQQGYPWNTLDERSFNNRKLPYIAQIANWELVFSLVAESNSIRLYQIPFSSIDYIKPIISQYSNLQHLSTRKTIEVKRKKEVFSWRIEGIDIPIIQD